MMTDQLKLASSEEKAQSQPTRTAALFRNGSVTRLTAGSDLDTDEDSREKCIDGPLVVPRD